PLEHKQLFAQLKAELDEGKRYWFSAAEESELKLRNQAYYALPTEAEMILHCFRLPEKGEDFKLYSAVYLFNILLKRYPAAMRGITINKMGRIMNSLGAERMHTTTGNMYKLVALAG
ncbi:helicase, partial [Phocaeicola vulgatus]